MLILLLTPTPRFFSASPSTNWTVIFMHNFMWGSGVYDT